MDLVISMGHSVSTKTLYYNHIHKQVNNKMILYDHL